MSKKQDDYYFDNFMKCAEYSCKAAYLLKEILTEFQPEEISKKMEEIHEIERQADTQRHEITDKLAKAFITPIEREDIIALSHHIDDVTDKIEEVLIRVYINNVQEMRQEVFLMLDVVIECCEELQTLLKEFKNFKHSKELKPSIIRMNTLEEKEDELFISSMRKLHVEEQDVRNIIAWREIYTYLEKCADACEHVADIVGSVAMKNQLKKRLRQEKDIMMKEHKEGSLPLCTFLVRMLQGMLIGLGAVLPGISGGVLCVIFGIYRPVMELLSNPRKYIFLPISVNYFRLFWAAQLVFLELRIYCRFSWKSIRIHPCVFLWD